MAYEVEKQLVYDELKANGGAVALIVPTAADPDPDKPWRTSSGTPAESFNTYAVFGSFKERDIDGTNILRGDRLAYVPELNLGVTPTTAMKLQASGETWQIVGVEPTDPTGEDPILYTLQLRR